MWPPGGLPPCRRSRPGQTATVLGTTTVAEPQGVLVYNFTVADDHTYFVEGFGAATNSDGTTGSAAAPLDAVWVHNDCAGRNHFFPRRLGSFIPYGSKLLTFLSKADHTAFHKALNAFLSKAIKDGYNLGRSNLSRKIAVDVWTSKERVALVREFMTTWRGGKYLQKFEKEIQWMNSEGGIP